MSLPARQQRMLDGIEKILQASEPKMAAMFAIFTRLTAAEGPASTERVRSRRLMSGPGLGAFVLLPLALSMLITGLLLGGPARGCGARPSGLAFAGAGASRVVSPGYSGVCYK